jgi:hypothetical protein
MRAVIKRQSVQENVIPVAALCALMISFAAGCSGKWQDRAEKGIS